MLLLDLSGIVVRNCINLHKKSGREVDLNVVRHVAFSSLLYYKQKFSKVYGAPIVCADQKPYWRETVFPYYKKNRKRARDDSDIDWEAFSENFAIVRNDIQAYAPYPFVIAPRSEADDCIAVLTQYGFARDKKVMIVSADKDMVQLQNHYTGVKQYSPNHMKLITPKSTEYDLLTHIVKGDAGDGIPNIFSPDDILVEAGGPRQKSVTKKILTSIREMSDPCEDFDDSEARKKFKRNRLIIDLTYIPDRIHERVLACYERETSSPKPNRMMECVRKYRLRNLVSSVKDF